MNIYLLNYNNYYNRICKKEDTLTDYLNYQVGDTIQGVNFNPNDGVNTELIVNTNQRANYLLAVEDNTINSRWFIIESTRLRNGQHKLMLRRDLIADNYNDIVNAPCFIEKATVNDSDPAIFNSENMTFNQIKASETELKDETGSAWVVGYIPRDSFQENTEITATASLSNNQDYVVDDITKWEYYKYSTGTIFKSNYVGDVKYAGYVRVRFIDVSTNPTEYVQGFAILSNGNVFTDINRYSGTGNPGKIPNLVYDDSVAPGGYYNTRPLLLVDIPHNGADTIATGIINNAPLFWKPIINTINDQFRNYTNCNNEQDTINFKNMDGKIIYETSTGLYKRIKVNYKLQKYQWLNISSGNLFQTLYNNVNTYIGKYLNTTYNIDKMELAGGTLTDDKGWETFKASYNYYELTLSLENIPEEIKTAIGPDRDHLGDQPYDMFCIPYSDTLSIYQNGVKVLNNTNKSVAINIAVQIAAKTGSGNIYDVQLLPYCPVRHMIIGNTFDYKTSKKSAITNRLGETVSFIFWGISSQGTFNIQLSDMDKIIYELKDEDTEIRN